MLSQAKQTDNFLIPEEKKVNRTFYWYEKEFCNKIQEAIEEVFGEGFKIVLYSTDKKTNVLWENSNFFVAQLNLTVNVNAYLRLSDKTIKILLDKSLGARQEEFKLKNITELEAKIITAYNNLLFQKIKDVFISNRKIKQLAQNPDAIEQFEHFIFYINTPKNQEAGKIILSLPPRAIKKPEELEYPETPLSFEYFQQSTTPVDIHVGSTKITLEELKNLEKEDIVILENSNINDMKLLGDFRFDIKVNPDPSLIINVNNNEKDNEQGGKTPMKEYNSNIQDVWDNIQIEVGAEFKKVKISLGELRQMSEGLVVDIAPVFQNEITLNVEGKSVAKGELVIIDDRYGVKLTDVFKEEKLEALQKKEEGIDYDENHNEGSNVDTENDEDDFDYSDFEIDDDI